MQNTVYERKQNGEDFILLHSVTDIRFGNCPANGLVTEQPQYSVAVCIFPTWQNTETSFISNDLRSNFTCMFFLAQPITFHQSRHTFGTLLTISQGVPIETVSRMMGHTNIKTTQIYAKITKEKISQDMEILSHKLESLEKQVMERI